MEGVNRYTLSSLTLAPAYPHGPSPSFISSSPLLLSLFFPESRTKAIDAKLSKMNLATCVTYGAGRRGGLGPGRHYSTGIICYSALIGPDKTIP